MGYKVYLEAEFKVAGWHRLTQDYVITYKMANMFIAAVGATPKGWDGMLASDLLPILSKALNVLGRSPQKYKKFEAKSGLGKVSDCVCFIMSVSAACRKFPFATVREES